MPECKRCTKRTLNTTDDTNHGYCESCLILVARELIAGTPDFDYTVQDEEWRVTAKETLTTLYTRLKEAGMPNPLQGIGAGNRALFWTLFSIEEYKQLVADYDEKIYI